MEISETTNCAIVDSSSVRLRGLSAVVTIVGIFGLSVTLSVGETPIGLGFGLLFTGTIALAGCLMLCYSVLADPKSTKTNF